MTETEQADRINALRRIFLLCDGARLSVAPVEVADALSVVYQHRESLLEALRPIVESNAPPTWLDALARAAEDLRE